MASAELFSGTLIVLSQLEILNQDENASLFVRTIGTERAYPKEAPFRCSTLGQAPGLTHQHQTRLERLAKEKRSSLLRKVVTYRRKKFYNIVTWSHCYKAFFVRDLQIFVQRQSVCQTRLENLLKTNTLAYYENP